MEQTGRLDGGVIPSRQFPSPSTHSSLSPACTAVSLASSLQVPHAQGQEMLRIFRAFQSRTSILDDFAFYDSRQAAMLERKVKGQGQGQQGQGQDGAAPPLSQGMEGLTLNGEKSHEHNGSNGNAEEGGQGAPAPVVQGGEGNGVAARETESQAVGVDAVGAGNGTVVTPAAVPAAAVQASLGAGKVAVQA